MDEMYANRDANPNNVDPSKTVELALSMTDRAERRNLVLPPVHCDVPEVGIWLAAMSDCRARTHKVLADLRPDELDWDGLQGSNTIGSLLYHIAAIELDWLYDEILGRDFPTESDEWFPVEVRDSAGILGAINGDDMERHSGRLQFVRDKFNNALSTMSQSDFTRVRNLEAYDVTPQWVLHHLLQHEAEHRSQIVVQRQRYKTLNR